jgi:hypothetical protein
MYTLGSKRRQSTCRHSDNESTEEKRVHRGNSRLKEQRVCNKGPAALQHSRGSGDGFAPEERGLGPFDEDLPICESSDAIDTKVLSN